jgi:hypothetical protein
VILLQPGYGNAQMTSPNASDQHYMSSYYGAPYMSFTQQQQQQQQQDGLGATGAWSNGGEQMGFLGGYGQQMNNESMYAGGMYGDFGYGQFGWGFPGGDAFNTWGNTVMPQPGGQRKDEYDQSQYYNMGAPRDYAINGEVERNDGGMKAVEQGLKGVSLNDKHDPSQHQQQQVQQVQQVQQKEYDMGGQGGGNSGPSQGSVGGGQSHGGGSGGGSQAKKPMTWASIASQPARPQPQMKMNSIPRAPTLPGKHNIEIGTWDGKNSGVKQGGAPGQAGRGAWSGAASRGRSAGMQGPYAGPPKSAVASNSSAPASSNSNPPAKTETAPHPMLDKLRQANQYNPKEFNLNQRGTRYFIIKSYSEDDIHRSIKYSIWCSTEHGNKRLDSAYKERENKGPVYLLFSVNGSGHFCGVAQMMSPVDYHSSSSVWAQDKWKGQFEVKWIYVKDVPNSQLRHIRLENNDNKPVTNSRDTQEVPPEKGKQVLKIIHHYRHTTSIFDDFTHYESRQAEEDEQPPQQQQQGKGKPDKVTPAVLAHSVNCNHSSY